MCERGRTWAECTWHSVTLSLRRLEFVRRAGVERFPFQAVACYQRIRSRDVPVATTASKNPGRDATTEPVSASSSSPCKSPANTYVCICATYTQSLLKRLTVQENKRSPTQFQHPAATYVLVLHVLEQPQLSVGSLGVDDGLEGSGQLFHRHLLEGLHVHHWAARDSERHLKPPVPSLVPQWRSRRFWLITNKILKQCCVFQEKDIFTRSCRRPWGCKQAEKKIV